MANLSAPIGAVVRVWFPESETVMQPGPKFRPGLILGFDDSNGRRKVLVAYGTSQRTISRGCGEFTVLLERNNLEGKKTKFCLKKRLWLELTPEYFCSGNGKQPEPETLAQEFMKSFMDAAQEAGLI